MTFKIGDLFKKYKKTIEGNLRGYYWKSENVVSVFVFFYIFMNKHEVSNYFGYSSWGDAISFYNILDNLQELTNKMFYFRFLSFIEDQYFFITFYLLILLWFYLYKSAVENEMNIISSIYLNSIPSENWEKVIGRKLLPIFSLGIAISFYALALFSEDVKVFVVIMLILNFLDAYGNHTIRQNFVAHFKDLKYLPLVDDLQKERVIKLRDIAYDYWVIKPQVKRVLYMSLGTVIALILSYFDVLFFSNIFEKTPQVLIAVIIISNECIMIKWRMERDKKLVSLGFT